MSVRYCLQPLRSAEDFFAYAAHLEALEEQRPTVPPELAAKLAEAPPPAPVGPDAPIAIPPGQGPVGRLRESAKRALRGLVLHHLAPQVTFNEHLVTEARRVQGRFEALAAWLRALGPLLDAQNRELRRLTERVVALEQARQAAPATPDAGA